MAEILFKTEYHANGIYVHPDPEKDEQGVYKKGYPVIMKDDGAVWGSKEWLPYFVHVNIPGTTVAEINAMIQTDFGANRLDQSWDKKIDYEVVNQNLTIDGWRLRFYATNAGAASTNYPGGKAGITRAQVESFITKWNGSVVTFGNNSVTFDVAIFKDGSNNPGALQSQGFWGFATGQLVFNETSYTQAGGIHMVEVDYSAFANVEPKRAEDIVKGNRGTVTAHDTTNKIITMSITRQDVLQVFKREVARAVERPVFRRQFRISEAQIDTIVGQGGSITTDLATLKLWLLNRLDEQF